MNRPEQSCSEFREKHYNIKRSPGSPQGYSVLEVPLFGPFLGLSIPASRYTPSTPQAYALARRARHTQSTAEHFALERAMRRLSELVRAGSRVCAKATVSAGATAYATPPSRGGFQRRLPDCKIKKFIKNKIKMTRRPLPWDRTAASAGRAHHMAESPGVMRSEKRWKFQLRLRSGMAGRGCFALLASPIVLPLINECPDLSSHLFVSCPCACASRLPRAVGLRARLKSPVLRKKRRTAS
jgi:hypothetical protein